MAAFDLPRGMQVFERGWLSANNILFTEGAQTALVDSGYCTHSEQTLALVEAALGGRQLEILVNTHLHSDHCGGNAALQGKYKQVQTLIPPGHAKEVQNWDPVALTYEPTGQLCPRFTFTGTLQSGSVIALGTSQWEIHPASGHDPHSVIFFEPVKKILLSADALWENGFGVVFPELEGEHAFSEVAATLDLIEKLDPAVVVPGHGGVFAYTENVLALSRQRLDAFVQSPLRHARHAAKVLLKFKLLELQRVQQTDFNSWAAATSYLSHIRTNFFAEMDVDQWLNMLVSDLVKSKVAKREGNFVVNV